VDFVRVAMGVEHGGYLQFPARELQKVEQVLEVAISLGIYVIVDWHDHNAEVHQSQAISFFRNIAMRYGHHPNLIFEPFNEPERQNWAAVVKPYHESVVAVIRQHSQNLVILGTPTWSQDVDVAAADPVLAANVAYTLHFYAASHHGSLRDKAMRAMSENVPLFVSEWGTCTYSGDGLLDLAEAQVWMDFLATSGISDANWAVSDKAESCAALTPGSSGTGGWHAHQLTESGRWVRQSLRDAGGVTSVVSSTTVPLSTGAPSCASVWAQCGGQGWTGVTCCVGGSHCVRQSDWYSQCLSHDRRLVLV